ncbi:hypothetical protein PROFUN_17062, partial [Planoprotostelium fungivorum]
MQTPSFPIKVQCLLFLSFHVIGGRRPLFIVSVTQTQFPFPPPNTISLWFHGTRKAFPYEQNIMAEQATTTLQALLNTDTSDVITALQSLEDCSKLRIIIEKMKEQLPGRTEILQLRSSVPAESEERKIVDNTRLITYKTNKDEWEGEKTGSFATWINWSLVEVKMEHMTEPLQLAFKHSIYSRNYYLEEDE